MEPIRPPDNLVHDQLLQGDYEQDEELHRVIIQSRQEFLEQEEQRKRQEREEQQKRQEQEEQRKRLAVPISRLVLWKNTTQLENEQDFLHHILFLLGHFPEPPLSRRPPKKLFQQFLDKHFQASTLYKEVYEICSKSLEKKKKQTIKQK